MIMEALAVIHIVNKHIRFGVEKSRLFISHSNVGLFFMCKCLKSLQLITWRVEELQFQVTKLQLGAKNIVIASILCLYITVCERLATDKGVLVYFAWITFYFNCTEQS